MASSFSWSYKRSYKNGYVWQDVGDDDLIFPAHGCEYVLKGSRIVDPSPSGSARPSTKQVMNQQDLPQNTSNKTHISGSNLPRNDRHGAIDDFCFGAFQESQYKSDITFEFNRIHDDLMQETSLREHGEEKSVREHREEKSLRARKSLNVSKLQALMENNEIGAWEAFNFDGKGVYNTKFVSPMENIRVHAATQTEDHVIRPSQPPKESSAETTASASKDSHEKPTVLEKGEISPPSCLSSSASSSASGRKLARASSPASRCEKDFRADHESSVQLCKNDLERAGIAPATPAAQSTAAPECARANNIRAERSKTDEFVPKSKSKAASSSGFLQFVSCGGVEVKQDLLRLGGRSRNWRRAESKKRPPVVNAMLPEACKSSSCSCELASSGMATKLAYLGRSRSSGSREGYSEELSIDQGSSASSSHHARNFDIVDDYDHGTRGSGNQRKSLPVFGSNKRESQLLRDKIADKAGSAASKGGDQELNMDLRGLQQLQLQLDDPSNRMTKSRSCKKLSATIMSERHRRKLLPTTERCKADCEKALQYSALT